MLRQRMQTLQSLLAQQTGIGVTDEWIPARIDARWSEASQLESFLIRPAGTRNFPMQQPGDSIDLLLPTGEFRTYSLSGSPFTSSCFEITVKRQPNGVVSSWLHRNAIPGTDVWVRGPNPGLSPSSPFYKILVGAGVGLAPLMPIAESLARIGSGFELHACVRTEDDLPFRRRFSGLLSSRTTLHISRSDGRINFTDVFARQSRQSEIIVCGPEGFLVSAERAARLLSWPIDKFKCERFYPLAQFF